MQNDANKAQIAVPFAVASHVSWPEFRVELGSYPLGSGAESYSILTFDMWRSWVVKLFVIINLILSWVLSLWILVIAIDNVLVRPRKVDPDIIGVSVTLLFALPGMRAAMPYAPPIGSLVDVIGLLWCLIIVSIASATLLAGYFGDHKHHAPLFHDEGELEKQEGRVIGTMGCALMQTKSTTGEV